MTCDELYAALDAAGFTLLLGPDGAPKLRGLPERLTPEMKAALTEHRERVVAGLKLQAEEEEWLRQRIAPPIWS